MPRLIICLCMVLVGITLVPTSWTAAGRTLEYAPGYPRLTLVMTRGAAIHHHEPHAPEVPFDGVPARARTTAGTAIPDTYTWPIRVY